MARSEKIRTYLYISIAVVCLLAAVPLGIDLLTAPNKADALVFFTDTCVFILSVSLLWNQNAQRPRDDPEYWRERAKEARTHAHHLTDPASQRMMLELASDYDKLAKRAEERLVLTRSRT
jgi:hypothetical protein